MNSCANAFFMFLEASSQYLHCNLQIISCFIKKARFLLLYTFTFKVCLLRLLPEI